MDTLIVVDMQKDFLCGALANPAAVAIVKPMADYIFNFKGEIFFTQDTHGDNYLNTQEGKNLPIPHCIKSTPGWQVHKDLINAAEDGDCDWVGLFEKHSFGDTYAIQEYIDPYPGDIYICGTCTDICVVSIALNLKSTFPEKKIYCIADLCAGTTPEKHAAAIEVMKSCQIEVI